MINFIKKSLQFIFLILAIVILYYQHTLWHNFYIGLLSFIIYHLLVGSYWQEIFRKIFALNHKSWGTKVFGWFAAFTILTLSSSILVIFYKLDVLLTWWCYVVTGIVTLLIWLLVESKKIKAYLLTRQIEIVDRGNNEISDSSLILFKKSIIYHLSFIFYLILWLFALYLLIKSHSLVALQSPWQTINNYYLPIFFILTILSGVFLFVKFKTKTILFILVLQTLLLHLYLPLTQQNPWGGDVWRHLARENQIQNGEMILPVLVGPEATWKEVININLPEVFLMSSKYSYGHLWGTSVLLSNTLQVNLLDINKWLEPIIWSLVMPFIIYRIGWIVFGSRRSGLILSWVSMFFYPLQALAALTLPVSFDFIIFAYIFMLWLQYLRDDLKLQRNIVLFFAFLMLFSYSLYFILIWVIIFLSSIIYHLSKSVESTKYKVATLNSEHRVLNKAAWASLILLSIFIIPVIELIFKLDYFSSFSQVINNLKQFAGEYSGWYFASAIRPDLLPAGNLIFNHLPSAALVGNIFINWRWWLIPAMVIFGLAVGFGAYKIFKTANLKLMIIALLFSTVFGGYFISWVFLDGQRLLARRLNMVVALLIAVLFVQGLLFIIYHLANSKYQITNNNLKKFIVILIVILFSWFGTFVYASGPDLRVVSKDEFSVAQYIDDNLSLIQSLNFKSCVLADTYVLLPLEALSNGQIVGGGFPIDNQFSQPERIALFNEMNTNPSTTTLELAHEKTGVGSCWLVTETKNQELRLKINKIFNSESVQFGSLLVWKEVSSTPVIVSVKKIKH